MFTPQRTTALLIAVTALLYARTLAYGFVFEDLNDFQTWSQPFTWSAWISQPSRMLTSLSFAAGQALSGTEAWGFHLVSVTWHLINGLLMFLLSLRVLPQWGATFAAGVFLLHPIQVESVAYISTQSELVSAACLLTALLLADSGKFALAFLACGLAVLAKETAVVSFLLVPLWLTWRGKDDARLTLWLLACVVPPLWLLPRFGGYLTLDLAWMVRTVLEWAGLLSLWILPHPLAIDHDWSGLRIALTGAVMLVVMLSRRRWALAGQCALLWSAVSVLPRLFVPQLEGMHEHHLMTSTIALSLCAGLWLHPSDAREGKIHGISEALPQA